MTAIMYYNYIQILPLLLESALSAVSGEKNDFFISFSIGY